MERCWRFEIIKKRREAVGYGKEETGEGKEEMVKKGDLVPNFESKSHPLET